MAALVARIGLARARTHWHARAGLAAPAAARKKAAVAPKKKAAARR